MPQKAPPNWLPYRNPPRVSGIFGCARLLLLAPFWLFLAGCVREASPDLVTLREIGPKILEAGGLLEVRGQGLPERRAGQLLLQGTFYVPGEAARQLTMEFPVFSESRVRASAELTRKQLGRYLLGADHGTFRGRGVLQFPPIHAGGPILRGELLDLVLDLDGDALSPGLARAAPSFSDFLGLKLDEGLTVIEVAGESEGERAGLKLGDRLVSLDGLRLRHPGDFLPPPKAKTSVMEYIRPGFSGVGQATVDRARYHVLSGGAVDRALGLTFAALLGLAWMARPPGALRFLGSRRRHLELRGEIDKDRLFGPTEHLIFLAAMLLVWAMLSLSEARASSGGAALVLLLGFAASGVGAFLLAGKPTRERAQGFRLGRALSGFSAGCLGLLPILVAALGRCFLQGTFRLSEHAAAQGDWPHEWALLSSPGDLFLGLAYLLALVPSEGWRGQFRPSLRSEKTRSGFSFFGLVLTVALWVLLFAGGGLSPMEGDLSVGFWLCGKTALTLGLLFTLRRALGQVRYGEARPFLERSALLLSLTGVAVAWGAQSSVLEAHRGALGFELQALILVSLLFSSWAYWQKRAGAELRTDPWI